MKMGKKFQLDETIKKVLLSKSQEVMPSDNMFENIKREIKKNDKKANIKNFFLLNVHINKTISVALCSILILVISFFAYPNVTSAIQRISRYVEGYVDMKDYSNKSSKADLKNELGYNVKIPKYIPGGYKLINSSIDGYVNGAASSKQYSNRGIDAIYSINNSREKSMILGASKRYTEVNSVIFKNAKAIKIGKTKGYYTEYKVHEVPQGTKISASEENDIKNGKEVLTYIESKNENVKLNEKFYEERQIKWRDNGVNYTLIVPKDVSLNQVCQVVQYIINLK